MVETKLTSFTQSPTHVTGQNERIRQARKNIRIARNVKPTNWFRTEKGITHLHNVIFMIFIGLCGDFSQFRKLTFWLIQFDRTEGVFNILDKRSQDMVKSDHSRCYIYSEVKSHSLSVNFSLLGLGDYNSMEIVWYTL